MLKNYTLHDHKLSSETPFEAEYFSPGSPIPLSIIDMHPTVHLGILLQGTLKFWIDGHERLIRAGECWLTNPLEPHTSLEQSPDREAVVATFLLEELGRGFAGWNLPVLTPFSVNAESRHNILSGSPRPEILKLGIMLKERILARKDRFSTFEEWLLIHGIYAELLRLFDGVPGSDSASGLDRLRPALMLPRSHPGHPVTLDDAAHACSLSPGRFGELFRLYTGTTFSQYETRFRLSGARNDVMAGKGTLKEIAADWGFYDESHFLKIFRKFYGSTPGVYRKKHLAVKYGKKEDNNENP